MFIGIGIATLITGQVYRSILAQLGGTAMLRQFSTLGLLNAHFGESLLLVSHCIRDVFTGLESSN